jgi:uncharacterized protein YlxP (DUF503 family)
MFVGFGVLDLHLPHSRDLKSKRRVVKGLVDRIHARARVSVAETGSHDLHQRAEIGIAVVSGDPGEVERMLGQVLEIAEQETQTMILAWDPQIEEWE